MGLNIGIIGTGMISKIHIEAYKENKIFHIL